MKPPVVAFFGRMLAGGTPRGALRLFRSIAEGLGQYSDLEFVCLGERVWDPTDPLGCSYEAFDGRMFLATLDHGPQAAEGRFEAPPFELAEADRQIPRPLQSLVSVYRRNVPLLVRQRLQPAVRIARSIVQAKASPRLQGQCTNTNPTAQWAEFPENRFAPSSATAESFRNSQVTARLISLHQIDVLLNFWWFHTPHPNPLQGCYRPPGLKVVAWFLDATPLRIPHWQPGMIPVAEFRHHVQAHLESADEVVAISHSAAGDITTFFPHIRKPVHVVPCGISEQAFHLPADTTFVQTKLGIDPNLPLFTFIGFQEPSKNVPVALRALALASSQANRELQALIIGPHGNVNLSDLFGPTIGPLRGRVRILFAGMVSELVKRVALALSTALIYPSKWEGFGMPPLEAMAVGTQVVASDIPPIREVCSELPEYCDPYDVDDIAAAIMRTIEKPLSQRERYAVHSRQHALRYVWANAAASLRAAVIPDNDTISQVVSHEQLWTAVRRCP